jgi:hypothetical protein
LQDPVTFYLPCHRAAESDSIQTLTKEHLRI